MTSVAALSVAIPAGGQIRRSPANVMPAAEFIINIQAIAGAENVLTELPKRTFYSTDMSAKGEVAEAVVRVDSTDLLSRVVRACANGGRIVIPRGGGFSYTGGYLPIVANTIIVDMRGMNAIVEINRDDMYVVVEAGCTWERLYRALKDKGMRTPYFGPMSGYSATVGGALSQGSLFLGSTAYGVVAESVLALEVVIADGSVVKTGSWASTVGTGPFLRNYGPDLTGLFLSDTGAMGLKTKAVLKLLPFPAHQQYASFVFDDETAAVRALSAIGRSGLAAECYCWDPYFVKMMAASSPGLAQDLKVLAGVVKGGSSLFSGLLNATRVAIAGKVVLGGDLFILNITIDDFSKAGADARLSSVRKIVAGFAGEEQLRLQVDSVFKF